MNTREQLELLKQAIIDLKPPFGAERECARLLDKLIAERPYEPGETILVGPDEDKATFLCVDYQYPDWVWADTGNGLARCWKMHNPVPKTYRVTVPEEIIEAAKEGVRMGGSIEVDKARLRVVDWLANPGNWEGGNE